MPPTTPRDIASPTVDPLVRERLVGLLAALGEDLERVAIAPYRGHGERSYYKGHWTARMVVREAPSAGWSPRPSLPRTCTAETAERACMGLLNRLVRELREKASGRRREADFARSSALKLEGEAEAMEAALATEAAKGGSA